MASMNALAAARAFSFGRVRDRPRTSAMTILIRPATPADIPAITAIYAHAVRHGTASFELEPPSEAEMARRQKSLLDDGFPYLVAENSEGIAGYAYAGLYRTRPAYRWSLEDSVYVSPAAHRRGVGRLLLQQLILESEERGFRQMIAVIGDSTLQTPSIELHRALGFRMVGVLENVGYKFGRWLDSVLMQRELGPGAATAP
jgi:L-amino acid N-acyltransferase YncA